MVAKGIHGISLLFKTEDAVGRYIYKHGIYEPYITSLIEKLRFRENDTVIDIGAHIGWYSILIDKLSPENVKIFSFEPDPLNFKLLKENLVLNSASKVTPINKAVGESNKKAKLFLYPDKNRGRHSLLPLHKYDTVEVDVIKLDDWVKRKNIKHIKLIKIDVEGYEYFVLKGGLNVLKLTENIILEYSPEYMKKGMVDINKFKNFLTEISNRFQIFVIDKILKSIKAEDLPTEGEPINLFLTLR